MLGAIAGDIIGSYYEKNPTKKSDFSLFNKESSPTDDTVMTLAVAEWLIEDYIHTHDGLIDYIRKWGNKFPNAEYGHMFAKWLKNKNSSPYGSYGNGSAMRVSPVGLYSKSLDEVLLLSKISAEITHNHPEGIKGAQAVAVAVWMAKNGSNKNEIKYYIENKFNYDLNKSISEARQEQHLSVTCETTVPQAIRAYLEGNNFEEVIRLAISLGGDADTQASIAGAIAAATPKEQYKINDKINKFCLSCMHPRMINGMYAFEHFLKYPTLKTPIRNSYKIDERIYAGEYPCTSSEKLGRKELLRFIDFGITHFIDLTEIGELTSYSQWLPDSCTHIRFGIKDCSVPSSMQQVTDILKEIINIIKNNKKANIYIHCRGGIGRTGTIVGCYYALILKEFNLAFNLLQKQFSLSPKAAYRKTPETLEQKNYILKYVNYIQKNNL